MKLKMHKASKPFEVSCHWIFYCRSVLRRLARFCSGPCDAWGTGKWWPYGMHILVKWSCCWIEEICSRELIIVHARSCSSKQLPNAVDHAFLRVRMYGGAALKHWSDQLIFFGFLLQEFLQHDCRDFYSRCRQTIFLQPWPVAKQLDPDVCTDRRWPMILLECMWVHGQLVIFLDSRTHCFETIIPGWRAHRSRGERWPYPCGCRDTCDGPLGRIWGNSCGPSS